MPRSQNDWPVFESAPPVAELVPDTLKLRVRPGDVAYIFKDLATYFDRFIERVDLKVEETPGYDDWGWAYRKVRDGESYSNHASGTAIDLNATRHPLGVRNTFNADKIAKIRTMLNRYVDPITNKRIVRWGGDYSSRADEMHFEINANSEAVARVADKLRRLEDQPAKVPPKEIELALEKNTPISVTGSAKAFIEARSPGAVGSDNALPLEWFVVWGYIEQVQISEKLVQMHQTAELQRQLLQQQNGLLLRIAEAVEKMAGPSNTPGV